MPEYPDKYQSMIDAETWDFIERTNAWYPVDTVKHPVKRQREIYDKMCREFFCGYPEGVKVCDQVIRGKNPVAIRQYRKSKGRASAQVVYLHGGGFFVGGLDSHDDVCAEICERTGFDVMSVDYRLAPEHLHPAGFKDALAGFHHAMSISDLPLIMAGDSAGGNFAAAVCHMTRGETKQAAGQVLIYPGLGGDMTRGSYRDHARAPLLTLEEISFYTGIRSNGAELPDDASYAPLWDSAFDALPPTVVVSAECDPLSDDGREYCKRITASGGKACWINEPGLVHGYLRARHSVKRAADSFSRIVEAIAALGKSAWPYQN